MAFVQPHIAQLSTTAPLYKKAPGKSKGGKGDKGEAEQPAKASKGQANAAPQPDAENATDFSDVVAQWAKVETHYIEELKKFRGGGHFDPAVLGSVPVSVGGMDFPLCDLAQVVPKGQRTVTLMLNESDFMQPILRAIQGSPNYNQQPQRDPNHEDWLHMKVEAEPIEETTRKLKDACHGWRERIRAIKTKRDKLIKDWEKSKAIGADLARKLAGELLKMSQGRLATVDTAEKKAAMDIKNRAS